LHVQPDVPKLAIPTASAESGKRCTEQALMTRRQPRRGDGIASTLLDLHGNIPSFIHISDGTLHDVHALDMLLPESGAIYVMDRGYVDFARLHAVHQAGAFFVTRAKSNPRIKPVGMPRCAPGLFGARGPNGRRDLRSDRRTGRIPHPARLP
jgi:hypothetical protein